MHSSLETAEKVPAFLYKLWKLVEDKSTDHLVRWRPDGKSFILYRQGQFSRELLPQYYKHNNMASFVRQLNMYGFRKVPCMDGGGLHLDRDEMEFAHPCFVRGHEERLEHIKRKMTNSRVGGGGGDEHRLNEVMTEVAALRQKQNTVISQMNILKRENELVWTRYADLQDKFAKQQNVINKLMRFIMTVMKPTALSRGKCKPLSAQSIYGHNIVPALTHGGSLSDGPVIHEVIDDAYDTSGAITVTVGPRGQTLHRSGVTVLDADSTQTPVTITAVEDCAMPGVTTTTVGGFLLPDLPLDDENIVQDSHNSRHIELMPDFRMSPRGVALDSDSNSVDLTYVSSEYPTDFSPTPMIESPKGTMLSYSSGQKPSPHDTITVITTTGSTSCSGQVVGTTVNVSPSTTMGQQSGVTVLSTLPQSTGFTLAGVNNNHLNNTMYIRAVRDTDSAIATKPKSISVLRASSGSGDRGSTHNPITYTFGPNNILIPTSKVSSDGTSRTVSDSSYLQQNYTNPVKQEVLTHSFPPTNIPTSFVLTKPGTGKHFPEVATVTSLSGKTNSSGAVASNSVATKTVVKTTPVLNSIRKVNYNSAGNKFQPGKGTTWVPSSSATRGVSVGSPAFTRPLGKMPGNGSITTMGGLTPSRSAAPKRAHYSNLAEKEEATNDVERAPLKIQRVNKTGGRTPRSTGELTAVTTTDVVPSDNLTSDHSRPEGLSELDDTDSFNLTDIKNTSTSVAIPRHSSSTIGLSSREDVGKQIDDMQNVLDNLQALFNAGTVHCDQNSLLNLFNPEFPLSDFDLLPDFEPAGMDQAGGSQQLSVYNPALPDLAALVDSPDRPDDASSDNTFAMAAVDMDQLNTPRIEGKRFSLDAGVKREYSEDEYLELDPLYDQCDYTV